MSRKFNPKIWIIATLILTGCDDPVWILNPNAEEDLEVSSALYVEHLKTNLDRTHRNTELALARFENARAQETEDDGADYELSNVRVGVFVMPTAGIGDYYHISGDLGLEFILGKIKK